MKTNELAGAALNWAVAKIIGLDAEMLHGVVHVDGEPFMPDIDWAAAGPIIEREMIDLQPVMRSHTKDVHWKACGGFLSRTPLIAAMRCYVASQLGDDIDVPKELK